MSEYRHCDTKRKDGVYISFRRLEKACDSDPCDYLFQDDEYREQDQARLDAFNAGEWFMIGIQAEARIVIVRNGMGTYHIMTSAGLWSIESDSGEDYLDEIFEQEKALLIDDIKAMGNSELIIS